MSLRCQQTLARPVRVSGRSLFHGIDVQLNLLPAPPFHGVVFERIDLPQPVRIPARIEHVLPAPRRTVLARSGVLVETVEHVLAALAGMHVDNCLLQLDAPECPNGDGSARPFVEAIDAAGIAPQSAPADTLRVGPPLVVRDPHDGAQWTATHAPDGGLHIACELIAPVPGCERQSLELTVTPQVFAEQLAAARTFVREADVAALRAQGLGLATTTRDLLVFDAAGRPLDNPLRWADECARHKILDAIGDFALAGASLCGWFRGSKTGHRHNHELVRRLLSASRASHRAA